MTDVRKLKGRKLVNHFANRVAKVMADLKSSHVYFVLQQAFGEDLGWHEAEEILNKVKEATDKESRK